MTNHHEINEKPLLVAEVREMIRKSKPIKLSSKTKQCIQKGRKYLEDKLSASEETFYGINTGFGDFHNVRISKEETEQLQENLVKSHACGTGDEVPAELVRLILFLKIQSLSYGHSGIRLSVVERLVVMYNEDILPVIYQQGSLGASGDLSPLAHLSLTLLGLGNVDHKGQRISAATALASLKLSPLKLKEKEGLALLNGTQFSTAYGLWAILKARNIMTLSTAVAALSCDAFQCHTSPFDSRIHAIRPHLGQQQVAKDILDLLEGSALQAQPKKHVQDPYAFRCIPQVHGASLDTLSHVEQVIVTEINAVTDNPNLFPDTDAILSGGNFHAQPIALVLDFLAIAMAEIGNISERRTYQLISGKRGLPTFLTGLPGLHSGLMIPQYTAASIVSQNKQYCTPASIDSIVSSNGQEDHVSMAANAGTKLYKVLVNVETVLAIEWLTATQALSFRRPNQTSRNLEEMVKEYRENVPIIKEDRIFSDDIRSTKNFFEQLSKTKK